MKILLLSNSNLFFSTHDKVPCVEEYKIKADVSPGSYWKIYFDFSLPKIYQIEDMIIFNSFIPDKEMKRHIMENIGFDSHRRVAVDCNIGLSIILNIIL